MKRIGAVPGSALGFTTVTSPRLTSIVTMFLRPSLISFEFGGLRGGRLLKHVDWPTSPAPRAPRARRDAPRFYAPTSDHHFHALLLPGRHGGPLAMKTGTSACARGVSLGNPAPEALEMLTSDGTSCQDSVLCSSDDSCRIKHDAVRPSR